MKSKKKFKPAKCLKKWDLLVDNLKKVGEMERKFSYNLLEEYLKAILTIFPLFYIWLFKMPKLEGKMINKIHRQFLWGCGKEKGNITWVN